VDQPVERLQALADQPGRPPEDEGHLVGPDQVVGRRVPPHRALLSELGRAGDPGCLAGVAAQRIAQVDVAHQIAAVGLGPRVLLLHPAGVAARAGPLEDRGLLVAGGHGQDVVEVHRHRP
jgi:hypothetical protein